MFESVGGILYAPTDNHCYGVVTTGTPLLIQEEKKGRKLLYTSVRVADEVCKNIVRHLIQARASYVVTPRNVRKDAPVLSEGQGTSYLPAPNFKLKKGRALMLALFDKLFGKGRATVLALYQNSN